MKKNRATAKVLLQFYLLVIYVLLQFCWWAYMISDLNKEVHDLKLRVALYEHTDPYDMELEHKNLNAKLHKRWLMIAGEGTVFAIILALGIYRTRKTFKKEFELARQQKNFLLSITHELKSPIASMKLQVETLLKRKLPEETQNQILNQALQETDRLNNLVEKVLIANRIESSAYVLQIEEFNLSQLCNKIATSYQSGVLKNHHLEISVIEDCMFKGDAMAITSVLNNLLDNAAKYSPQGSSIKLSLKKLNNAIVIEVSDKGVGIKTEEMQAVFHIFYRSGNEEVRNSKGTGLGLFIVKSLVDLHQGSIAVAANNPKGTVFTIKFEDSKY